MPFHFKVSSYSYDRITPNTWSGAYQCWGKENREAPLTTACPPGIEDGLVSNFETKAFDGCANPHLGLAAIIATGIDGLRRHLRLPEPIDDNPYSLDGQLKRLPASLSESLEALQKNTVLHELIGEKLMVAIKDIRKRSSTTRRIRRDTSNLFSAIKQRSSTTRRIRRDTSSLFSAIKVQLNFVHKVYSGIDNLFVHKVYSGDLGQTFDSNRTLTHYEMSPEKGQAVLFVGDLSYADNYPNHDNNRWDSWGRFAERSAAYQPWIWTAGNHELDFESSIGEIVPFKLFKNRYRTPNKASGSTSPLWYSIKRASAHIIVLSSYSAYVKYQWLEADLPKVNRTETPWLIVLLHSPWYNSYNYHFMEGESMRVMFEQWFVEHKPFMRVMLMKDHMTEPQPAYSAYCEASFGHAMLSIKNRTHAYYAWHRNQVGYAVESDKMWFFNRHYNPVDDSTKAQQ
ncbi:hypothetical protein ACFE04_019513 [Oxalis oulophora]